MPVCGTVKAAGRQGRPAAGAASPCAGNAGGATKASTRVSPSAAASVTPSRRPSVGATSAGLADAVYRRRLELESLSADTAQRHLKALEPPHTLVARMKRFLRLG